MKYFFGYYEMNGLWWPLAWAEEGGAVYGIRPHCQSEDKREVSFDDFHLTLRELMVKYPKEGVTIGSLGVGTFPT